MPELRSWGFDQIETIPHSDAWTCPYPNCGKDGMGDADWEEYLVGFRASDNQPSDYNDRAGELILECPNCLRRYWFHTTLSLAQDMSMLSSKWPK